MNVLTSLVSVIFLAAAMSVHAASPTEGMLSGKVELKSIGPLAFGPDGVLLIADARSAALVALDTQDRTPAPAASQIHVKGLNQKIAGVLGTEPDQVLINDLTVNPISRNVYVAVSRGRGPDAVPVLIKVARDGKLEAVSLNNVRHSRAILPNPPADAMVGQGQRQSNPRLESITDVAFVQGRVVVAGLSNEEFASTLRAIPFPFKSIENGTSVEIYHGAHGKFETRSPIRTFVNFEVNGEEHLLAAYTCTPLVQFPMKELQPGAKIKGKTIAELGNRNRPLDMIAYRKEGKDYLLIANSSRGIMKVDTANLAKEEAITTPVPDGSKKGLAYETVESWKGVDQLDRFDLSQALVLRRGEGGGLDLDSLPLP